MFLDMREAEMKEDVFKVFLPLQTIMWWGRERGVRKEDAGKRNRNHYDSYYEHIKNSNPN